MRRLVEGAHGVAREILETNRQVLDAMASELIDHETLEVERVQAIFSTVEPFTGSGVGRPSAAAASDSIVGAPAPRRPTS